SPYEAVRARSIRIKFPRLAFCLQPSLIVVHELLIFTFKQKLRDAAALADQTDSETNQNQG
ncbi:MAG: hypothetical protein ACXWKH_13350, partial [Limisphaerales bacterium]